MARAYAELTAGLRMTPEDVLTTTFDIGHDEMVLVRDIELWSMCEHHLVPFTGVAHVGYIPAETGKITGLSKLARLVDVYAKRPQVQERLTTQVADALMRILEARGVIVVIEAEHLCMTMRGVRKAGARTITSAVRGQMHNAATRSEAMALISSGAAADADGLSGRLARTDRPVLMGVVNVTPDSFSDGGRWATPDAAIAHGRELLVDGSRHPRRRRRVDPARRHPAAGRGGARPRRPGHRRPRRRRRHGLGRHDAQRGGAAAVEAGARDRQRRLRRARRPARCSRWSPATGAAYVAMHWRAHSDTMQQHASYDGPGGVVAAVRDELAERVEAMLAAGIAARPDRAGPGHRLRQDRRAQLGAAARARADRRLGFPVLVGASRKSFLGSLLAGSDGVARGRRGPRARHLGAARPARPGGRLGAAHARRPRRARRAARPRPLERDPTRTEPTP